MKIILLILLLGFTGCLAMDKYVAPCQRDVEGNCIPGTHTITPQVQNATENIPAPYNTIVWGLLVAGVTGWNFFERKRANAAVAKANKAESALQGMVLSIQSGEINTVANKETLALINKNINNAKSITQDMITRA